MRLRAGTPVRAAGQGIAICAGDGVTTLYGHLETIRVKSADAVAAGAATDRLHFELRIGGVPVDPAVYFTR